MLGSSLFRLIFGQTEQYGVLSYPTTLALSDAAANSGTMKRGKAMAIDASDIDARKMKFADTDEFKGFLMNDVDELGTTGDKGFKEFTLAYPDMAIKRGAKVSLLVPTVGCQFEIESDDNAADTYDNFIVTKAAETGLIETTTALNSLLTFGAKGCMRVAQTGETAFFRMIDADRTPETTGNIRIRVEYISPYKVTA